MLNHLRCRPIEEGGASLEYPHCAEGYSNSRGVGTQAHFGLQRKGHPVALLPVTHIPTLIPKLLVIIFFPRNEFYPFVESLGPGVECRVLVLLYKAYLAAGDVLSVNRSITFTTSPLNFTCVVHLSFLRRCNGEQTH